MSICEEKLDDSCITNKVREIIEKSPSAMIRSIALDLSISELDVVKALPCEMKRFVPAADFTSIWEEMVTWESVTFLAETSGAILEICGPLSKGVFGRGMYNLMDKSAPLNGHIFIDKIAYIALVSKPIFNLESHSVQFFSLDGKLAFAVYLGRQADKSLIPSVLASYNNLWSKYTG